jgi:hypothetical protein
MTLTYKKLTKHPHSLRRLLGIDRDKMEQLVVSLTPLWEAHLSAKYPWQYGEFIVDLLQKLYHTGVFRVSF